MLNPRKSSSAIDRVRQQIQHTRRPSDAPLVPGDRVMVLDMCGRATGIQCIVQNAEAHSVGVIWGGDTILVGRSWVKKVN
jgi:hypothetical protein